MARKLTFSERERISQMYDANATQAEIAEDLNRDSSTISRELKRNSRRGEYSAVEAQGLTIERRRDRPLVRKMDRPEVAAFVRARLAKCWSPDQIACRAKADFPRDRSRWISPQTIYTWIGSLSADERRHFSAYLRRGGTRRSGEDRRGRIPRQVSIEGRPQVVNQRRRYGDWEGDTVVGAQRSGAIVTLVERKSGYLLTAKTCDRKARRVADKMKARLGALPPSLRRSATLDNGKEFADHEYLAERLGTKIYFAHPYCSWERGTNEHTNGLLRQFLPKGTDFRGVSWQELEHYTHLLNDRPRKRLGYRTPAEVFEQRVAIES